MTRNLESTLALKRQRIRWSEFIEDSKLRVARRSVAFRVRFRHGTICRAWRRMTRTVPLAARSSCPAFRFRVSGLEKVPGGDESEGFLRKWCVRTEHSEGFVREECVRARTCFPLGPVIEIRGGGEKSGEFVREEVCKRGVGLCARDKAHRLLYHSA